MKQERQPIQGKGGITFEMATDRTAPGRAKGADRGLPADRKTPGGSHLGRNVGIGLGTLAILGALAGGAAKLSGVIGGGGDSNPDTANPGAVRTVDKNFPNSYSITDFTPVPKESVREIYISVK